MGTTRHLTAALYVLKDGATALLRHKRHHVHLPPGGLRDKDEPPQEAGRREVREEMRLDPAMLSETPDIPCANFESLPRPRHHLLCDANLHDGTVGHLHIDLICYATVPDRDIDPQAGEVDPEAWTWYTPGDLSGAGLEDDVMTLGRAATQAAK